ncbi:MAG: serine hydrolase [Acetobacteraceae bacterium]|jgi:CubicO group peptidase (beta-lactamase class C family)
MRSGGIRRGLWFVAAIAVVAALGVGFLYVRRMRPVSVATGTIAQVLCTEVFVSHLAAEDVYRETLAPALGSGLMANHVHWSADRQHRTVTATWFGRFASTAVYRGAAGCLLSRGHQPPPPPPLLAPFAAAWQPEIAGPQIVEPSNPALVRALDNVFADPATGPARDIKAIVVVKDGQVVAERYAPGVGIDTPLLGYSVGKLVINALAGILVGQGRLHLDTPAPIAAWAAGDDPRHAITLDNLLRMTSGLAIPETDTGLDAVSRMLYTEPDMAGFAAQAPLEHKPGSVWAYSSGNTLLTARMIADAVGGTEADVLNFARTALFGPLGMHCAVIETDAAGTPVGSTFILASARDWARLGLLYLNDGVVAGHRVLPDGWVSYTRRPTLNTDYGAGVSTNAGANGPAKGRIRAGMPEDAFFASGRLGQRIYILPSQRLVVVRFGVTQLPDFDIAGDLRLLRELNVALPSR